VYCVVWCCDCCVRCLCCEEVVMVSTSFDNLPCISTQRGIPKYKWWISIRGNIINSYQGQTERTQFNVGWSCPVSGSLYKRRRHGELVKKQGAIENETPYLVLCSALFGTDVFYQISSLIGPFLFWSWLVEENWGWGGGGKNRTCVSPLTDAFKAHSECPHHLT